LLQTQQQTFATTIILASTALSADLTSN